MTKENQATTTDASVQNSESGSGWSDVMLLFLVHLCSQVCRHEDMHRCSCNKRSISIYAVWPYYKAMKCSGAPTGPHTMTCTQGQTWTAQSRSKWWEVSEILSFKFKGFFKKIIWCFLWLLYYLLLSFINLLYCEIAGCLACLLDQRFPNFFSRN